MTTEELRTLRLAVRDSAMIYQSHLKACAAEHNGVPFEAYAHLPYAEWAEIRTVYLETHDMRGMPRT